MKQGKKQKRVQSISKKEESLSYTVEVRDKKGRILQQISAPSRSYVEQWNQVLSAQARSTLNVPCTNTEGNPAFVDRYFLNFKANAPIASTSIGIRVGKGTTAVAIDDFALETPLEEGTGVDEFEHQAVTFSYPAVVGPTCSFTVKRIMINNSGAPISDIREIGCYITMQVDWGLAFRDVLPGGVNVPDGGSITVIYTIAATV